MAIILGIKLINDFAYKKTFGDPYNRLALISLLNAILMLDLPIVDVVIQKPIQQQGLRGRQTNDFGYQGNR